MNNKIAIFTNTHAPRLEELEKDFRDLKKRTRKIQAVEELERKVSELMAWKEASLRVHLK